MSDIAAYLAQPEADRNFAEGVALLEAAKSQNQTQLKALKGYTARKYVSQQTKIALYIALKKILEGAQKQEVINVSTSKTKNPKPNTPLSIYAILASDPLPIKDMILQTGRMHDEAFAARNALIHLHTNTDRHEYGIKAVQLYRRAAQNWQKIKLYRETGSLPPELMLSTNDLKKLILEKIERKKYLIERTYRIQSWIDGKTKPPNQKHEPEKWKTELENKIQELETINEWLNTD